MIRVLHVVPSLEKTSGVTTFVHNALQAEHKDIEYSILHFDSDGSQLLHQPAYDDEYISKGIEVYRVVSPRCSFGKFLGESAAFFSETSGQFDIVHCHAANAAFCMLGDARAAGIAHRLLHSHLNASSERPLRRLRNKPLNAWGLRYATARLACSSEAGLYLFGNKSFHTIRNGIQLERFAFDATRAKEMRTELGLSSDDLVIGCVGRLAKQKNFVFAVHIFSALAKQVPAAKLLVVGDGDEKRSIESAVEGLCLSDKVLLLGNRDDVNRLYSAMDVFFMPSLCEGLPFAAVEAQAAGLPCVYSTGVPRETDITLTGHFLDLHASADEWVQALLEAVRNGRHPGNAAVLDSLGYSSEAQSHQLINIYKNIMNNEDTSC